jgi:hypothetical protein
MTTIVDMAPSPELSLARQTAMLHALQAGLGAGAAVRLIETHISWVLIHGGQAYKFKKALKTAFLDQTCLAGRWHACQEELRLNRRLAPHLYLAVVPVAGTPEAPVLGGEGPAIDVAVLMRAFDQEGLWDALAQRGALQAAHIDALVAQLLPFHDAAAMAGPQAGLASPEQVRAPVLAALAGLEQLGLGEADRARLQQLRAWEAAAFGPLAPLLARRLAQGRVRECHGDLHLGNVTQIEGHTTVFDGIEFSDALRWIDVLSDLAFMAMDLHAHGLPALAHRLVNAYLEASGDYGGVPVLRYYQCYRALVRAQVMGLRAGQQPNPHGAATSGASAWAQRYLAQALAFTRPKQPVLMITHGYSGSGKTTQSQGLVEATGAVRIRSDVERKRMAGLAALARGASALDAGLYAADQTAATYARLNELAVPALQSGFPVILDATFLRRVQRDQARALASDLKVPFAILDFEAPEAALRQRIQARAISGGDASDADVVVLERQMQQAQPLQDDEREVVFSCQPEATRCGETPGVAWGPLLARWTELIA